MLALELRLMDKRTRPMNRVLAPAANAALDLDCGGKRGAGIN